MADETLYPRKTHRDCWRCARHGFSSDCSYCGGTRRVENEPLTRERLAELMCYDHDTGDFIWLKPTAKRAKPGDRAGWSQNGYITISIDSVRYSAHRLAWYWVHGRWPYDQIDHIDMNRANNRIENLRECSSAQNNRNGARRATNTSGYKGVHYCSFTGRWRAQIFVDYKKIDLGLHDTPEEAHAAYIKAAKRLFGEFARAV